MIMIKSYVTKSIVLILTLLFLGSSILAWVNFQQGKQKDITHIISSFKERSAMYHFYQNEPKKLEELFDMLLVSDVDVLFELKRCDVLQDLNDDVIGSLRLMNDRVEALLSSCDNNPGEKK